MPCFAGLTYAGPADSVNWALRLPLAATFSMARCDFRLQAVCIACMQLAGLPSLLTSAAHCRDNALTAAQQPRPTLATF